MQNIIKSKHLINDIEEALSHTEHDRLFFLSDENTGIHCYPYIQEIIKKKNGLHITIPANENNKNLQNLSYIWQQLSENFATRHSLLINLGGGMICDIGGFAAATFKRGITYFNIPTTLLAIVDAAVGGKTAINFGGYKNEIGAFHLPKYVFLSSLFLRSLSQQELLSGYAEIVKHALIYSDIEWKKILNYNFSEHNHDTIIDLAYESVKIKQNIVNQDPLEKNIRKALNFGHTVGHALESLSIARNKTISHGNAVALGLISELYLSYRLSEFPKDKLLETVRFIRQNYPLFYIDCNDYDTLLEFIQHDKKNKGNAILVTLLQNIGKVEIDQEVSKDLIFESLDFYRDTVGI